MLMLVQAEIQVSSIIMCVEAIRQVDRELNNLDSIKF